MLQIRPMIRSYIWYRIGDGFTANAWFDNWCEASPLSNFFSARDVCNAGFSLSSTVLDLIMDDHWRWPMVWSDRLPPMLFLLWFMTNLIHFTGKLGMGC